MSRLAGRHIPPGGLKAGVGSSDGISGSYAPLLPKPLASAGGVSSHRHGHHGGSIGGMSKHVSSPAGSSHGGGDTGTSNPWSDIAAAITNKYVWYLGAVKFIRDIAGEDCGTSLTE